jgi:hypothetical protein
MSQQLDLQRVWSILGYRQVSAAYDCIVIGSRMPTTIDRVPVFGTMAT